MSTTYGIIALRTGEQVRVEAYGTINTVKIEDGNDSELIALNSPDEMDRLIDALELAREHCWGERI